MDADRRRTERRPIFSDNAGLVGSSATTCFAASIAACSLPRAVKNDMAVNCTGRYRGSAAIAARNAVSVFGGSFAALAASASANAFIAAGAGNVSRGRTFRSAVTKRTKAWTAEALSATGTAAPLFGPALGTSIGSGALGCSLAVNEALDGDAASLTRNSGYDRSTSAAARRIAFARAASVASAPSTTNGAIAIVFGCAADGTSG